MYALSPIRREGPVSTCFDDRTGHRPVCRIQIADPVIERAIRGSIKLLLRDSSLP